MQNLELVETEKNKEYKMYKPVYTIKREKEFNDHWVARKPDGTFVDKDQYRYDLFERLENKKEEESL